MKPLAKRLYLALTAIVMIVCLSIGLAACGKKAPEAFATPEGVKIEGNVLSWNEVDGAVEYTVKINDDETTVVFTTSLDLTTKKSLLKEGSNTLAVKANEKDGKPASAYSEAVNYNYTPETVTVTSVTVTSAGNATTVKVGKTLQLTATVVATPDEAANKGVTWTSSDNDKATVSATGLVTAKAAGQVTITATSTKDSTKKATITLTVEAESSTPTVTVTSVTVTAAGNATTVKAGETLQLTATVAATPDEAANKGVTWTSSDATKATVSATGLVTAKAAGQVTITATSTKDNTKKGTITLTVEAVAADQAAASFIAKVNAIASATDKAAAIESAKAAYNALDDAAKAIDGVDAAIATLKTADKAAYEALVNAIVTVEATSENAKEEIAAAKAAITAAKDYKETLVADDVATLNTKLEEKEKSVKDLEDRIEKEFTAYETAVEAVLTALEAEESATTLEEAIEATKAVEICAATTCVKADEGIELADKVHTASEALKEWKKAIEAAEKLWNSLTISGDAEQPIEFKNVDQAELSLKVAKTYTDAYAGYAEYVKNAVEDLTEKHEAMKTLYDAAEAYLQKEAKAITDEYEALEYAVTKEYYKALKAVADKAAAIKADTRLAEIWANDYAETDKAIKENMATLLNTIATIESDVFITGGREGKVSIVFEGRNVLGENLVFADGEMPEIALKINDEEAEATIAKYGNKYTATAAWTASTKPDIQFLKVEYTVGEVTVTKDYKGIAEGEEGAEIYKFDAANTWFNSDNGYKAFDENGVFNFTTGSMFVDIYNADDLVVEDDNSITVKGLPIATKLPVTTGVTTEKDLRTYLAVNYSELITGKPLNLRFVLYRADEETGLRYTLIDHERVSHGDCYVTLSEDDTRLDFSKLPTSGANWNFWLDGNIHHPYEVMGAQDGSIELLWDEVHVHVYNVNGIDDLASCDFSKLTPFATYDLTVWGGVSFENIDSVINAAWKKLSYDEKKMEYTFVLAMQVEPNKKAEDLGYTASALKFATIGENSQEIATFTREMYIEKVSNTIIDTGIWGANDNFAFTVIDANNDNVDAYLNNFNGLVDEYELTHKNATEYFEVLVEVYESSDEENAAFTKVIPFSTQSYSFSELMKEWTREYFKAHSEAEDEVKVEFKIYMSVRLKEEVNGEANKLIKYFKTTVSDKKEINEKSIGEVNCREYTFKKSDLSTPKDNVISFNEKGDVVVFLEANQPAGRGSIFNEIYGVTYIEIWIKVGSAIYPACLCKGDYIEDLDDYKLNLFMADEEGNPLFQFDGISCDRVKNGWVNVGSKDSDLIAWMNESYGLKIDTLENVTFSTKIHHDGSYFIDQLGEKDFSDPVAAPVAPPVDGGEEGEGND